MKRTIGAWVLFWVGFGLLDYWADRRGRSLCHAVRHLFRTHHPYGRTALTVSLGVGALTLRKHLLKR